MKISNPRLLAGNVALATQNYVSSYVDDKLFVNDKIKASLLPDISITSVTTIKLDDILNSYNATNIQNPKTTLLAYLSTYKNPSGVLIKFQQGDVIIVTTQSSNYNSELVGPWIVTSPTIENENQSLDITKLIFPTAAVKSVNGFTPDDTGNITVPISSYTEFVALSSQVDTNVTDIQTLSGKLDNLESVSKLSADLGYVSGVVDNNITNISGNTETINAINAVINKFNNYAFYVNSLTFSLNAGSTSVVSSVVSSVPFGDNIQVSISALTDNSIEQFGTGLKLYSTQITLPQNSEIIETYLVNNNNNISENFYPDILISGNMYTINILAGENELEDKQLKIVYSNYNTLK